MSCGSLSGGSTTHLGYNITSTTGSALFLNPNAPSGTAQLELPPAVRRLRLRLCGKVDGQGLLGLLRLSRRSECGRARPVCPQKLPRQPDHTFDAVCVLNHLDRTVLKLRSRHVLRDPGKEMSMTFKRRSKSSSLLLTSIAALVFALFQLRPRAVRLTGPRFSKRSVPCAMVLTGRAKHPWARS